MRGLMHKRADAEAIFLSGKAESSGLVADVILRRFTDRRRIVAERLRFSCNCDQFAALVSVCMHTMTVARFVGVSNEYERLISHHVQQELYRIEGLLVFACSFS